MIKKIISVIFVLSGVFMVGMLLQTIPSEFQNGQTLVATLDVLFLCLYALSVFAGIQLWREHEIGKALSWYLLLFQTLSFDLGVVTYRFTSLVDFFVYYRLGESLGFDGYFGAGRFALSFPEASASIMIGLNVVAIALLAMFSRKFLPEKIAQLINWINEEETKKPQGNFA
jgi:hypothetical protein